VYGCVASLPIRTRDTRGSARAVADADAAIEEVVRRSDIGEARRVFFLRSGLTNRSAAEFPSRSFPQTFFLHPNSVLPSDRRPSYPSVSQPSPSWCTLLSRVLGISPARSSYLCVHSIPVISFLNFLVTRTTPTTLLFQFRSEKNKAHGRLRWERLEGRG